MMGGDSVTRLPSLWQNRGRHKVAIYYLQLSYFVATEFHNIPKVRGILQLQIATLVANGHNI